MSILDKFTLRSIIAVMSVSTLLAMIAYILYRADVRITVSGSLDVSQVMTTFLALIGVVLGWLFGRQEGRQG